MQKDHLIELFRCAAARQTEIMVQNILGQGLDIPLLGLREACKEVEGNLHELFTEDCYKIANCFLLSTSQVDRGCLKEIFYIFLSTFLHIYLINAQTLCTFL